MIPINNLINIVSLLIALSSLAVALVALKIARKTFIYSSKDFTPDINFRILEDESLEIINNSNDLCKIDYVNYIKIRTIGFEDFENNSIVEIPFITKSLNYRWIEKVYRPPINWTKI
jgi:hypothetical protein